MVSMPSTSSIESMTEAVALSSVAMRIFFACWASPISAMSATTAVDIDHRRDADAAALRYQDVRAGFSLRLLWLNTVACTGRTRKLICARKPLPQLPHYEACSTQSALNPARKPCATPSALAAVSLVFMHHAHDIGTTSALFKERSYCIRQQTRAIKATNRRR